MQEAASTANDGALFSAGSLGNARGLISAQREIEVTRSVRLDCIAKAIENDPRRTAEDIVREASMFADFVMNGAKIPD